MFIDGENFMTMLGFSKYGISTFPKIWEVKQPTIDGYVMQKLIELEQEVKKLKKEIKRLKNDTR